MLTKLEGHYSFDFDCLDDMLRYCQDNNPTGKWIDGPSSRRRATDFHKLPGGGKSSWKDTVNSGSNGWPEGRERFNGKVMEAAARCTSHSKRQALTVEQAGFMPLVPLYASGAPAYMLNFGEGSQQADTIVRLQVDLCAAAGHPSERIINWGSALCVLIDSLENSGKSVEVAGVMAVETVNGGKVQTVTANTVIKPAGQSLDIDRMAFALAHPCYLRRLFFALVESVPETHTGYSSGYGACRKPTPKHGVKTISGVNANRDAADCLDTAIERVERIYNGD